MTSFIQSIVEAAPTPGKLLAAAAAQASVTTTSWMATVMWGAQLTLILLNSVLTIGTIIIGYIKWKKWRAENKEPGSS